jgi:hypothetical protein
MANSVTATAAAGSPPWRISRETPNPTRATSSASRNVSPASPATASTRPNTTAASDAGVANSSSRVPCHRSRLTDSPPRSSDRNRRLMSPGATTA